MSAILVRENIKEVKEMIVPIKGNVTYPITLDPTVWIFDDRKILFDDAFTEEQNGSAVESESDKTSRRWSQEVYQQIKPPVNRSIKRFEREQILKSSYVMPIDDFLNHAEIKQNAKEGILVTDEGNISISLETLKGCLLLFAIDGKPLKNKGPVHLFYRDGTNRENPITGVQEIIIE